MSIEEDLKVATARATAAEQERDRTQALALRKCVELTDRATTAESALAEARGALREARKVIDRDRTGLAAGLNAAIDIVKGYHWLAAGEWGSYRWDERTEKTIRAEIGNCFAAIAEGAGKALRESGTLATQAVRAIDAALARAGEPVVVMAPLLPVDDAADARMADLRSRQPPETKRPIAGEPASSGQEVAAFDWKAIANDLCDELYSRVPGTAIADTWLAIMRKHRLPVAPPPGEQGKGGGEGLAALSARRSALLESTRTKT